MEGAVLEEDQETFQEDGGEYSLKFSRKMEQGFTARAGLRKEMEHKGR